MEDGVAILFVHGRDQQDKDPQDLKRIWDAALARGIARAGISAAPPVTYFPYYGDELARAASGASGPREVEPDGEFKSGPRTRDADVYAELEREWSDTVLTRARASDIAESDVDEDLRTRGEVLNRALEIAERLVPGAGYLARAVFSDVATYLGDRDARRSVLDIVGREFDACLAAAARQEPTIVVGHSLGSVVVHDLLNERDDAAVDLLVTVGSPLGLTAMRDGLQAALKRRPLWPRAVRYWINASDPRDVIALIPALGRNRFFAEDYKRNPDARCDVLNLVDIDNDTKNRHGIVGYLADPGIARAIAQANG